jgi:hypothetical protein
MPVDSDLAESVVVGRSQPLYKRRPFGYELAAVPVRTRLIAAGEDLPALVATAVRGVRPTSSPSPRPPSPSRKTG